MAKHLITSKPISMATSKKAKQGSAPVSKRPTGRQGKILSRVAGKPEITPGSTVRNISNGS